MDSPRKVSDAGLWCFLWSVPEEPLSKRFSAFYHNDGSVHRDCEAVYAYLDMFGNRHLETVGWQRTGDRQAAGMPNDHSSPRCLHLPELKHKINTVYSIIYTHVFVTPSLIAMFMGPTWGPPGADRTQVGAPYWPHEPCYLGCLGVVVWAEVNRRTEGFDGCTHIVQGYVIDAETIIISTAAMVLAA